MKRFGLSIFALGLAVVAVSPDLRAQEGQEALPDTIEIDNPSALPTLDADVLKPPPPPEKKEEEEDGFLTKMPDLMNVPSSASPYTSRNFVGLALSHSNAGVTRGLYKISQDKLLMGKVSESAWGMGLLIDLGWSEDTPSSFRMKWGLNRVRVGLSDALRAQNGPDTLEESLNTAGLDFLLRDVLPTEDADLWWGGGFAIRYAWSSNTAGSGSGRLSKLRHSSVLAPMLSVGSDVTLEKGHQLVIQGDWLLINAYQLSLGLRTQL